MLYLFVGNMTFDKTLLCTFFCVFYLLVRLRFCNLCTTVSKPHQLSLISGLVNFLWFRKKKLCVNIYTPTNFFLCLHQIVAFPVRWTVNQKLCKHQESIWKKFPQPHTQIQQYCSGRYPSPSQLTTPMQY